MNSWKLKLPKLKKKEVLLKIPTKNPENPENNNILKNLRREIKIKKEIKIKMNRKIIIMTKNNNNREKKGKKRKAKNLKNPWLNKKF